MLSPVQLDALRELASIGAGHAATALSQLVDRKVVITVPELEVIPIETVSYALGGPETLVAAIYVRLLGDARGGLVFVIDDASARALASLLKGAEQEGELKEPDHELLRHAGSMLLSAFINALSRTTRLTLIPGSPAYAHDMVGGILQTVVAETEGYSEEAVLLNTDFLEEEEESVRGRLFFLPAPGSLEVIAQSMGV